MKHISHPFTRRLLLTRTLVWSLAAGGVTALLNACGGSSDTTATPATGGDCQANGTTVSIGSNHGHGSPTISSADVVAGTQQTFGLTAGSAGHTHTVTVSAVNFTDLKGNTSVVITTDADGTGHSHGFTIDCA